MLSSRHVVASLVVLATLAGCNCSPENPPADGGTACTSVASCPETGSECLERACVDGRCTVRPAMVGLLVTAQTPGDCRVNQCDGVGNVVSVVDEADVEDDGNDCTVDTCVQGAPSHGAADAGVGCGADGGLVCDGAGACVGCVTAADCPGQDTDCRTRACNAGTCEVTQAPAGTVTATQAPGDCQENRCTAAGDVEAVALVTDVPVDGNACTDDVCTGTTPSNPPTGAGTACADGGVVCDGAGACVACNQATDCPGQDTFCRARACTNHVCGFTDTAANTALPMQTAGDCRRAVCDGAGGTSSAVDDADVPVDGNACTDDVCTAGAPSNPQRMTGASCGANLVCNASGQCVGCVTAADCPGTSSECGTVTCTSGACGVSFTPAGTAVAMQTASDCQRRVCDGMGAIASQADDADVPVDGNQCTQDVCTAGVPSNPPSAIDSTCSQGGGTRCDGAGACVACTTAAHCPAATECVSYACTAGACTPSYTAAGTALSSQTASDCQRVVCNGTGGTTSQTDDADVPVDGLECTQDVCTAGVPSNPALTAGTACTQGGGAVCNGAGGCVACNVAADCGTSNECVTYSCTAGACSAVFTASGTAVTAQTASDCQRVVCNGTGGTTSQADDADVPVDGLECTQDVCTAGVPSNPALTAGTACTQGGGAVCNGAGACVGCNVAADCGTPNECVTYSCTAGACSAVFTASGTPVTAQTASDCQRVVCNGTGGTTSLADNADVPVDGLECTDDVCTAGVPSNPPRTAGTACTQGGIVCDGAGSCTGCNVAADCGTDTECVTYSCTAGACGTAFTTAGTAVTAQTAGDCQQVVCNGTGGTTSQADNADVPVDGLQCTQDVCTAGVPSNPAEAAGTVCTQSGGTKCDGAGACVECLVGADCASGVCTSNVCQAPTCSDTVKNGQETDTDCGGSTCAPCNPGQACVTGTDCETGECTALVCQSPRVVSSSPADGATGVAATSTVSVTFSTAMSGTSLTLQAASGACTGALQVSADDFVTCVGLTGLALSAGDTVATVTPAGGLASGTRYRVRVTTAAQDGFGNALGVAYVSAFGFDTAPATSSACGVVISQVYGGGGNTGAPWQNDFVELKNLGTAPVNLTGWSVQYASSTGSTWSRTNLPAFTLPAGAYFLVQLGGGANGAPLPTPDLTGTTAMGGTAGKVALVNNATTLSGTCPTGTSIVDFVGYGAATNCFEGAGPTPTLSNLTSAQRASLACADTGVNAADFFVATPVPRNSTTVTASCNVCSVQNETGTGAEADYCNLQFPGSMSVAASTATPTLYGRIYEAGSTEAAGAAGNVVVQVGWAPAGVDPRTQCGWQFFPASFNVQVGNDDEYQASFTAPAYPGSYRYTFRYSVDNGANWTYGDLDGAGSNAGVDFDPAQLGVLTVP